VTRLGFPSAACALAFGLAPSTAAACPCSDDPGGQRFLTPADGSYALLAVASSRRALGVFDAHGDFRAQSSGELEASEELLLRSAFRQTAALEWQAELGAASYRFRAPRVVIDEAGVGDVIARARYLLRREDPDHLRWALPALSLSALVRAPTGRLASNGSPSFGSGGAQLGLGAWEAGAGLDASKTWNGNRTVWVGVEGAYRFPDETWGRQRYLGPRLDLIAAGMVEVTEWLTAHLALSARFTADVTRAGQELDGSGERLVSVAASLTAQPAPRGFRSSLSLSIDPPLPRLSRNVVSAAALSVSVGWGG
jgi:hypothetical protein